MNKLTELKRITKQEVFTMNKSVVLFALLLAALLLFSSCNDTTANTLPPEESDPSQVLSESPSEEARMIRTAEDARELLYEGITKEEIEALTGKKEILSPISVSSNYGWMWILEDGSLIEAMWGPRDSGCVRIRKNGETEVIVAWDNDPSLPEGD